MLEAAVISFLVLSSSAMAAEPRTVTMGSNI